MKKIIQGCLIATTMLMLGSATFADKITEKMPPVEDQGIIWIAWKISINALHLYDPLVFSSPTTKPMPHSITLSKENNKLMLTLTYTIPPQSKSEVIFFKGKNNLIFSASRESYTYNPDYLAKPIYTKLGDSCRLDLEFMSAGAQAEDNSPQENAQE